MGPIWNCMSTSIHWKNGIKGGSYNRYWRIKSQNNFKSGRELSERHIILLIVDPQEQTYYIKTVKVNQNTIRRSQTLGDKLWNGGLSRTSCLYCRILCLLIFFHFFALQLFIISLDVSYEINFIKRFLSESHVNKIKIQRFNLIFHPNSLNFLLENIK